MRSIHKNVPVRFQPYEWIVKETEWSKELSRNNETIFTVANGYLGIRGFFEEGFAEDEIYADRTTMINGIYEYHKYNHIWCRPGFPERFHAIVGQANPFDIALRLDGEKICLTNAEKVSEYSRILDMRTGTVTRRFIYEAATGAKAVFTFVRFASQEDKHLAADKITVEALTDCSVTLASSLSIPKGCGAAKEEIGSGSGEIFCNASLAKTEGVQTVSYQTKISQFGISVAALDTFVGDCTSTVSEKSVCDEYAYTLKAGERVEGVRYVAYATNRDFADYKQQTLAKVQAAAKLGFDEILSVSCKHIDEFWKNANIEIDEDVLVQQGLRFSAFQIFQSTGKDGITNISANGLTGTAYSGHTFWDTEVFMMPMYIYTNPEIAKQLIIYRYNILDKARERAVQMDDQGALFSWNSINGEECGHVFEAVTAQYHINNDVFYAIYRYFEATQDEKFLVDYCAEILFEISKCMAHRGSFIPNKGNKFCINVICGPDEYNPIVDNNLYTNVLTQKQLYFTLKVKSLLQEKYPEKLTRLCEKCKVDEAEFALWKRAADNMYIAYSKELDMYMQDDNFIYKDPIDVDKIPREQLPLLTHLHPLNLWRYQVCKQADIVLLCFICSDYFTAEERKKIFDYYEPRTIHDSSLSASIHSIVACDVGDTGDAYGYLKQAARMDLDNVNGNTYFGLHAACMGAAWMMMVNGYAGLRIYNDTLHFRPFIHEGWKKYTFTVLFHGTRLRVCVDQEKTVYTVLEGKPLTIEHNGKQYSIETELVITAEDE